MKPFDFVDSVSFSKKNMMVGTENDQIAEKSYVPFLTNKALSYHIDGVLYANEMNRLAHIDKKLQYEYLLNSLRRRKRFAKWSKPSDEENIDLISRQYGVNREIAKTYLNLLSDDQISFIKKQENTGDGVKNNESRRPRRSKT